MNAKITVGFVMLVTLSSPPVFAESPCAECIKTVQEALKNCLANAISVDDKNTCEENREEGMKACEDRECYGRAGGQGVTKRQTAAEPMSLTNLSRAAGARV